MFERFSLSSRQIVELAQMEARSLNHDKIATVHLLLAHMRGLGMDRRALRALGLTYEHIQEEALKLIEAEERPLIGVIPFTPRIRKVFEQARIEAVAHGNGFVFPQYILLALIHEDEEGAEDADEETAIQVLRNLGVDLEKLRFNLLEHIARGVRGERYWAIIHGLPRLEDSDMTFHDKGLQTFLKTCRVGGEVISRVDFEGDTREITGITVRYKDGDGNIASMSVDWPEKSPVN